MKRMVMVLALACVLSSTALAGEMPGVNPGSAVSQVPPAGSTTGQTNSPPVPGEMPGIGSATSNGTDGGFVTTVLLTIITLIGR